MSRGNLILTGLSLFLAACSSAPRERPRIEETLRLMFTDLDLKPLDVDAALTRGETVALVFWQPTCSSCRREAPALNRAVEQHGDAIRFVGVVPGESFNEAELKEVASSWEYEFTQVRDPDESLCGALDVTATPTLLVIGPEREVRYRGHRPPRDWRPLIDR